MVVLSPTQSCLLVFLKAPEAGKVKTRLAQSIGVDHATALYCQFLRDLLGGLRSQALSLEATVWLWYTPAEGRASLEAWLGSSFPYTLQQGNDLGERLVHAFREAHRAGFQRAIALGSDSPDLPLGYLQSGLEALQTVDCVVGPAQDGGYYAIGFRGGACEPQLFQAMPWSTPQVWPLTRHRLQRLNRSFRELPPWWDIDTLEDLRGFYQRNQGIPSHTLAYLRQFPHLLEAPRVGP